MKRSLLTIGAVAAVLALGAATLDTATAHGPGFQRGAAMAGYGMQGYGTPRAGMQGYGMQGYGAPGSSMRGYGMPGNGMSGYGMPGYGSRPGMGPGFGMGPRWSGDGAPMRGRGYGMGPAMWADADGDGRVSTDEVESMIERHLARSGNENLKIGTVEDKDDTIVAEIVTQDGSLVERLAFDAKTGRCVSAE